MQVGLLWQLSGKKSACNSGDVSSVPGLGNGTPLKYSCLENPMDKEAWWATVNVVMKSWTQLKSLAQIHTHMLHFTHLKKKNQMNASGLKHSLEIKFI